MLIVVTHAHAQRFIYVCFFDALKTRFIIYIIYILNLLDVSSRDDLCTSQPVCT